MLKLERYIGKVAELIYVDRQERITQRRVIIRKCGELIVEVFCLHRKQPRSLRLDRILAVKSIKTNEKHIS